MAFFLLIAMLSAVPGAFAAQPSGYWPYYTAYTEAVESGNTDEILRAGDDMLDFYSQFEMNWDIASMSYNIYYYRYQNALFEKDGDYAAAIDNAEKLVYVSDYLEFTDMVVAASARIEKLDPMTEVYALSGTASNCCGALNEPQTGTYYGRIADMSNTLMLNADEVADEAIVSFYVELGTNTAADFSWVIDDYDDGKHAVHIALNFPDKAETASEILTGIHDENIKQTLSYLSGFNSPVLLRIGGEMNLWEMDAAVFIRAYKHVAQMARSIAPDVALVWSPNYVGSWGSRIADFYPGNTYVDWVGASLYTNSQNASGYTDYSDDSMYFGRGAFADCVLSLKTVAEFAEDHNKPVVVTEGGTGIISISTGADYSQKAVVQTRKMYAALNMVFPNVKAIIYSDTDFQNADYKYALSNSAAVSAAYDSAVASNTTLISDITQSAPSYIKLSEFSEVCESVNITAYSDTLYSDCITVTYYLSGEKIASKTTLPYSCTIDASSLAAGQYEFKALFSDGDGYETAKTYTLTKLMNHTVTFTDGFDASASLDVPSEWAQEEVGLALDLGLVPDTMACSYTANITRLDFCRLVINLIEQKAGKTIDAVLSERGLSPDYSAFTDTSDKNVLAAYALEIVNGRGNNIFDCDAGINREEAAKMLKNAADILGVSASAAAVSFSDAASFSSWAVEGIGFVSATADQVSGKVVMGGTGGNMFSPKGTYTRQQAFVTMLRLYRA